MGQARKITVKVPAELLDRACKASGHGITETVRAGLQLIAASYAYREAQEMRGKVQFSRSAEELTKG